MAHKRIRPFNTKDTYPEQKLDNDLCQAVVAKGTMVFVRGQIGQDLETSESVGLGDPAAQTHQAMQNIKMLLEESGSELSHICRIVVYLTDWRDALLRIGYDRSDYKILDAVISPGGRLRMHLRWFNRDRTGAVISTPEMNYYLSRVSDRGWRISMIDVLVPDQAAAAQ